MEMIIEFLGQGIEAMNGFGDTLDSWSERAVFWGLISYLKMKLWALEFSYALASHMLTNIGISAAIESAWGNIDSSVLAGLTYLRIPEGLNIVVSALLTRFIMDLI